MVSEGESGTDTAQEETHRKGGILNEEDVGSAYTGIGLCVRIQRS